MSTSVSPAYPKVRNWKVFSLHRFRCFTSFTPANFHWQWMCGANVPERRVSTLFNLFCHQHSFGVDIWYSHNGRRFPHEILIQILTVHSRQKNDFRFSKRSVSAFLNVSSIPPLLVYFNSIVASASYDSLIIINTCYQEPNSSLSHLISIGLKQQLNYRVTRKFLQSLEQWSSKSVQ